MANPISLSEYLPNIADVPTDKISAARARILAYLQQGWPDVDFRPGSVYGDLLLSPAAFRTASYEVAAERMFSDLDLANVAANIIYNCDIVRAYLKNFAAVEQDQLKATGLLRLSFTDNAGRYLDRGTTFLFGTAGIFTFRLSDAGSLQILATGSVRSSSNQFVLSQVADGTYVVDVPVLGVMPEQVSAGDSSTVDRAVTNLASAKALNDFDPGAPEDSLPVLAARTRETFYASSLASRGGAAAFVRKEFTDISGVSAAISGDTEMLRDTVNAIGVRDGRLDVYVKSTQGLLTDTQVFKLTYNADEDKFIGRISFTNIPSKIDAVLSTFDETLELTKTVYSRSLNATRAPLATAAYSNLEDLWLVVDMPRESDLPQIQTETDGDTSWAYFAITYRFDPGIANVNAVLNVPDIKPVGVDVLVKGFVPVIFSSFGVTYAKSSGKQVNLTQARTEILDYLNQLAYPNVYMDSKIGDAMLYAGALGVSAIPIVAGVAWSVADKFLPDSAPLLSADYDTAVAAAITPPVLSITSTANLVPTYQDPDLGTGTETRVALGKRNIGYILDLENLAFTENLP